MKALPKRQSKIGRYDLHVWLNERQIAFLDAIGDWNAIARTEVVRRLVDEAMARDAERRRPEKG